MPRIILACTFSLASSLPALSSALIDPMPPDGGTGVGQSATLAWSLSGSAPSAGTLYGAAFMGANSGSPGPSTFYTIDPSTGAFTAIGPIGFNGVNAMEFGEDGVLYAVAAGESAPGEARSAVLIRIDPATGAGTFIANLGVNGGAGIYRCFDLARSPSGLLCGAGYFGSGGFGFFSLDPAAGPGGPALTLLTTTPYYPAAIDFDGGGILRGIVYDGVATPHNYFGAMNPSTGALTPGPLVVGIASDDFVTSGDFHPESGSFYFSFRKYTPEGEWRLARADPATGIVTLDEPAPSGFDTLAFAPGDAATFDVYLDTGNPPTTLVCDDAPEPACDVGPLQRCATYYWRVVATVNGTPMEGPVWSFTTGFFSPADVDGDGDVDFIDLNALLGEFGQGPTCPAQP